MIPPNYDVTAATVALRMVPLSRVSAGLGGTKMIDGMRADFWLKLRKQEVYNPFTNRKDA